VPDLKSTVPDLGVKVPDPKLEVPDLRSGGIRLNLTPELIYYQMKWNYKHIVSRYCGVAFHFIMEHLTYTWYLIVKEMLLCVPNSYVFYLADTALLYS